MSDHPAFSPSLLKQLAYSKQNPEFAETVQQIAQARQYADRMVNAGKFSPAEREVLEAICYQTVLEELPLNDFEEMMHDGRLDQLQALGGVVDAETHHSREAVFAKLKQEIHDTRWLDGDLDSRTYAEKNLPPGNEELADRLAEGDDAGVASEIFASRHDVSTHEADLNSYLDKTYGEDRPGRDAEKPPEVVRESEREPARSAKNSDPKTIQEELTEFMDRHQPAPPSAVDANGITDLDILVEQEADQ